MRELLLAALCACGQHEEPKAAPAPKLDKLTFAAPDWTSNYDAASDEWALSSPAGSIRIAHAPSGSVASPEAFQHARGATTPIENRKNVRDGFTFTTMKTTYVVRHLKQGWLTCESAAEDRELVIAICKSVY